MEKKQDMEFDFDLPEVEGAPAAKPRIHHVGESVCVSCEG